METTSKLDNKIEHLLYKEQINLNMLYYYINYILKLEFIEKE